MLFRIINKQTNFFIRDDFTHDTETELALDVDPAQGFYKPKWGGDKWVEGATQEEIDELTKTQPHVPTVEERLAQTEGLLKSVTIAFNEILQAIEKGGMVDE